jgi:hypothetical protein
MSIELLIVSARELANRTQSAIPADVWHGQNIRKAEGCRAGVLRYLHVVSVYLKVLAFVPRHTHARPKLWGTPSGEVTVSKNDMVMWGGQYRVSAIIR